MSDWWDCGRVPCRGFTPRPIDTYWTKGAAIVICQDEETTDWLDSKVPTLSAWEGSTQNDGPGHSPYL
jgi:hypothetical protein